MSQDEPPEKPSSISAIQERTFDKLWDRVTWLLKLESSRADHTLELTGAVESDRKSRDRLTEAVLLQQRTISEHDEKLGYIKGGVDALVAQQSTKQAIAEAMKAAADKAAADKLAADKEAGAVATAVVSAVEGAVDRITKTKIKLPTKEELEGGGESSGESESDKRRAGVFYTFVLVLKTLNKTSFATKMLTFILSLFLLAGFLGWLLFKVYVHNEVSPGAPIERSRSWRQERGLAPLPLAPQVSFPPAPAK